MDPFTIPVLPVRRAQAHQATNDTRAYINGVWVLPDRIFATDGHSLYVCPHPSDIPEPFLLHIPKLIPKRATVDDEFFILPDPPEGIVMCDRLNFSCPVTITTTESPPNYETVLPEGPGSQPDKIGFANHLLARLERTWPGTPKEPTVSKFTFYDKRAPVRIDPTFSEYDDYIICMPAVIEEA